MQNTTGEQQGIVAPNMQYAATATTPQFQGALAARPQGGLPFYLENERQKLLNAIAEERNRPQPKGFLGRFRVGGLRQQGPADPALKAIASMPPPPNPPNRGGFQPVPVESSQVGNPPAANGAAVQPNTVGQAAVPNTIGTVNQTETQSAAATADSNTPIANPPPPPPKRKDAAENGAKPNTTTKVELPEPSSPRTGTPESPDSSTINKSNEPKQEVRRILPPPPLRPKNGKQNDETAKKIEVSEKGQVAVESKTAKPPLPPRHGTQSPIPQQRRNSPILRLAKALGVETGSDTLPLTTENPLSEANSKSGKNNAGPPAAEGYVKTFSSVAVALLRELESFSRENLRGTDTQRKVEGSAAPTELQQEDKPAKTSGDQQQVRGTAQPAAKSARKSRKLVANNKTQPPSRNQPNKQTAVRTKPAPQTSSQKPQLYGDWKVAKDATSGDDYYYNTTTMEVSWELPPKPRVQRLQNGKKAPPTTVQGKSGTNTNRVIGRTNTNRSNATNRTKPVVGSAANQNSKPTGGVKGQPARPQPSGGQRKKLTKNVTTGSAPGGTKLATASSAPTPTKQSSHPTNMTRSPTSGSAPGNMQQRTGKTAGAASRRKKAVSRKLTKGTGTAKAKPKQRPQLTKADPSSGWHSTRDLETGDYYYFNTLTQEVTWEKPKEVSGPIPLVRPG